MSLSTPAMSLNPSYTLIILILFNYIDLMIEIIEFIIDAACNGDQC